MRSVELPVINVALRITRIPLKEMFFTYKTENYWPIFINDAINT